jgi:hypothetical protein
LCTALLHSRKLEAHTDKDGVGSKPYAEECKSELADDDLNNVE